jgi:anhydro-N-acetylmuramic acid kinase
MEGTKVLGVMSGTSLDGVDLALCNFYKINNQWQFEVEAYETIAYDQYWHEKLAKAYNTSGLDLTKTDHAYGRYLGEICTDFINRTSEPEIIASHGHTIFHDPENHYTLQIGNGAQIAAKTGITTVCDFRTTDIALGGQGAPLVPIGDQLLFNHYDACLNIGGISNISFEMNGKRVAYDICVANIVFNTFAQLSSKSFDENGDIGRSGAVIDTLFLELNNLDYYHLDFPKSLGYEYYEKNLLPLFKKYFEKNSNDILRTYYEHVGYQIARVINTYNLNTTMVTGGGAYNQFLIECINRNTEHKIHVPDNHIVEYKEAMVFAFLGMLRFNEIPNTLNSVTGAEANSIGGAVYLGKINSSYLK